MSLDERFRGNGQCARSLGYGCCWPTVVFVALLSLVGARATSSANETAAGKAEQSSHPSAQKADAKDRPGGAPSEVLGGYSAPLLARIDRKIAKEPSYTSKPRYCLLAFGPEAKTRLWLVHDGDSLYVDRNANGDLTEEGERVAAKKDASLEEEGVQFFEVGDIHDGKLTHKGLRINVKKLDRLAGRDEQVKAYLAKDRQARVYTLTLDVQVLGWKGTRINGRAEQCAGPSDVRGFLEFADKAEHAPVVHFGGPWQITLYGRHRMTVGRPADLVLALATPGLGVGSTALVSHEGIVPRGVRPKARITYPPPRKGEPPVKELYELHERCCVYNFHDTVRVPATAGVGKAKVALTFDEWPWGRVAASQHEIDVVAPKADLELEAVSSRLKQSLIHSSRNGWLVGIQYSPDGKRIIAGDYPGGVLVVWDAESGRQLTKIETGYGHRVDSNYFFLSPDWSTVYVCRKIRRVTAVENDNKRLYRWELDGDVRAWDVSTGQLRTTFKHDPPRGIVDMVLSPDGSAFVTFEESSGESERPRRSTSLWKVESKKRHSLAENIGSPAVYSRDGKSLAALVVDIKSGRATTIKVFDVATAKEKILIPITGKNVALGYIAFSPDGRLLVGQVRSLGFWTVEHWLKFWDPATGREVASFQGENNDLFMRMAFSPDSETLAVTNSRGKQGKLFLFSPRAKRLVRTVNFGERATVAEPTFSADGKWIAVQTQVFRDGPPLPNSNFEDFPQPRIHLVDAATGAVRETFVAPQGFISSACFSADGKTLATGSTGKVFLWDLERGPVFSEGAPSAEAK